MDKRDAGTMGHGKIQYSEFDFCLVFRRWANSTKNVEHESLANVHIGHLALNVEINRKLEALVEAEHGKELREQNRRTNDREQITTKSSKKGLEKVIVRT